LRKRSENTLRRVNPIEYRQNEVHDDHIRPQALSSENRLLARCRESDDVHSILASKQGPNSIAYDAVVVDYQNASQ
jgi:hypothetical protein